MCLCAYACVCVCTTACDHVIPLGPSATAKGKQLTRRRKRAVAAYPNTFMGRTIVTPGVSIGTRIIDCCRCVGAVGSVLPIKMEILQRGSIAPEIHHLRPLITYLWSACRCAHRSKYAHKRKGRVRMHACMGGGQRCMHTLVFVDGEGACAVCVQLLHACISRDCSRRAVACRGDALTHRRP